MQLGRELALDFLFNKKSTIYITKINPKEKESKQDDPNRGRQKKTNGFYHAPVKVNAEDGPLSPNSALVITPLFLFILRRKLESR